MKRETRKMREASVPVGSRLRKDSVTLIQTQNFNVRCIHADIALDKLTLRR